MSDYISVKKQDIKRLKDTLDPDIPFRKKTIRAAIKDLEAGAKRPWWKLWRN